mmetsp:Transcript_44339/g.147906  ORF Transcript_44339/g.147906 Transcript_44339/m.147906 type:complete len:377 (+) Transcript_44339:1880-3010(+)
MDQGVRRAAGRARQAAPGGDGGGRAAPRLDRDGHLAVADDLRGADRGAVPRKVAPRGRRLFLHRRPRPGGHALLVGRAWPRGGRRHLPPGPRPVRAHVVARRGWHAIPRLQQGVLRQEGPHDARQGRVAPRRLHLHLRLQDAQARRPRRQAVPADHPFRPDRLQVHPARLHGAKGVGDRLGLLHPPKDGRLGAVLEAARRAASRAKHAQLGRAALRQGCLHRPLRRRRRGADLAVAQPRPLPDGERPVFRQLCVRDPARRHSKARGAKREALQPDHAGHQEGRAALLHVRRLLLQLRHAAPDMGGPRQEGLQRHGRRQRPARRGRDWRRLPLDGLRHARQAARCALDDRRRRARLEADRDQRRRRARRADQRRGRH